MIIGVLSDTHIPGTADSLPERVAEGLKGVDMILHAGDLTEESVLGELNRIAPTTAVAGNMDSETLKERLPRKKTLEACGIKIGLIHGYGPPFGMAGRIRKEFGDVNVIVFGHSHSAMNARKDGVLFFNPGSSTDNIFARQKAYGILRVKKGAVAGEIIKL